MFNRFLLGKIRIAPGVIALLGREPLDLVARHAVADFGRVGSRVKAKNMRAISGDVADEVVSKYPADPTDPRSPLITVTTLAGWGMTIVTLPGQTEKDFT